MGKASSEENTLLTSKTVRISLKEKIHKKRKKGPWSFLPCSKFTFSSLKCRYLSTAMLCYAKSLQSCLTLCDPINGSPPGSPVPEILQARTLEWVAISSSNAWKWKVKVKSLSRVRLLATHGLQPTRLLRPWDLPDKSTGVGCHCLLLSTARKHQSIHDKNEICRAVRKLEISVFKNHPFNINFAMCERDIF